MRFPLESLSLSLSQTREPARSRVVDLCSSSASGQNTPRWSMVSERDSLERINALASDVESGGTCYITACTNPQTKVNSVNLFDAQRTGRATPVAKMEEHTKGLMRVAVRDGTDSCLVASGDKAGIVKLWDPRASAASFKTCVASPCFSSSFFLLPDTRCSPSARTLHLEGSPPGR